MRDALARGNYKRGMKTGLLRHCVWLLASQSLSFDLLSVSIDLLSASFDV